MTSIRNFMRTLRNVPIQRKLRIVMLSTCAAALIVACGTLFVLQFFTFRSDFQRDIATTAEMIGSNSVAALTFKDENAAQEILGALKAKPHIKAAEIVLLDGTRLASYGGSRDSPSGGPSRAQTAGDSSRGLLYTHSIAMDGEAIGTLVLHSDFRAQAGRLFRLYAGILLFVLIISFLMALLVSWKLERVILDPIQSLADTAQRIAEHNDYSVRAQKLVDDEVGSFTDSFNSMLDQIQSRDASLLHEIAERKRTESELEKLHVQLVDASRQAGMAEVATGVLHNVGNVLNSVNVSATLIAERLGQSKVVNLVKATALFREQNGGLAEYLTTDPKGRLLPGYLADLGLHLEAERIDALSEITLLNRNIEHIKDIVSMQQSYARVSGFTETLAIDSMLEDALRLNVGSLERHGVAILRDYDPVPPATLDKHKVLQILVNVIRNAKHAMDDADPPEKRLTLGIRRKDEHTVSITFTDTGVGISPENITRIFSHGFTTRKDGHGFGLHTSALAAQQMGGRLTAHSEGPGHGAVFILELPFVPATATP